MKHERWEMKQLQMLSLQAKIDETKMRIREWYEYWNGKVFVSVSGKDSTVLLDMVRSIYPDVLAVYVDTGLEYPEVRELALSHDNVKVLYPKKKFLQVLKEYGYPIISKEVSECVANARHHLTGGGIALSSRNSLELENMPQRTKKLLGTLTKRSSPDKSAYNLEKWKPLIDLPFKISNKCCSVMKKSPVHKFVKESGLKPMTGQMASESRLRMQQWLKNGCNGFEMKQPISNPMSFWTEQDVLAYVKKYNIKIPSVYGDIIDCDKNNKPMMEGCGCKLCTTGCDRTGCMYCGYGCHLEKESRFLKLKETHPRVYEYCIGGGEWKDGLWQPTPKGLGLGYVFDCLNEIYGKDFIKYK